MTIIIDNNDVIADERIDDGQTNNNYDNCDRNCNCNGINGNSSIEIVEIDVMSFPADVNRPFV